jgi:phospholipid/cholesterol/gamma-HCH transport system permease protein
MTWVAGIGESTERSLQYVGGLTLLTGRSLLQLITSPLKRGRMLQRAVHQAMAAGVNAIPIVSLITFFIGLIIALQGAYELRKLGAISLVASMVAISITRELGPLVTAIMVIGRSGSSFAAEIGTMRVTEELDALETMAIMVPCLTIWADLMGVLGGSVFGVVGGGFTFTSYMTATRDALLMRDLLSGILKSAVFGLVITAVGCQEGFMTGAGAEDVGKSTTSAVVISILMVILIDLIFTAGFYMAEGG